MPAENARTALSAFGLGDADLERVATFGRDSSVDPQELIDTFYDWLEGQPWSEKFFPNGVILRVKRRQVDYWREFLRARVDDQYIDSRKYIGAIHAKIGLPLDMYIAGMSFAQRWLAEKLFATSIDPDTKLRTLGPLMALCQLDAACVERSYTKHSMALLRESKALQVEVMNATLDPLFTIDGEGLITYANRSVARVFGWYPDELLGKNISVLMPEPFRSEHDRHLERFRRSGESEVLGTFRELRAVRKNGEEFDCEVAIAPVESGGASTAIVGVIRDISDRKAVQRTLEHKKEELEQRERRATARADLVSAMRGGDDLQELSETVIENLARVLGADMGALYVTEGTTSRLVSGYGLARSMTPADTFELGEGVVGQAAKDQRPILLTNVPEGYTPVASALGHAAPRQVLVKPFCSSGNVVAVVELSTFGEFEGTHLALLNEVSEQVALAFEVTRHREDVNRLLKESQRQSAELLAQQEELRASNEALEAQAAALRASEEQLRQQREALEALNESLEIKNRALAERNELIEEKRRELERIGELLRQQKSELQNASRYKSEFLSNMSHELRTPLNSMLLLAQALTQNETGNLTADQVESMTVIQSSGQDLLALINDILDLSKVEAGRLEVRPRAVSVAELVRRLELRFRPLAEARSLLFECRLADDVPERFETDPARTQQILTNLLSNAVKFTMAGRVTLSIATRGEWIAFSVVDTGVGIPDSKREAIFDAFKQVDGSSRRSFGGTGLGLTISRKLAHLLGGTLELDESSTSGSRFTLCLPAAPEKRDAAMESTREARESTPHGPIRIPDELAEPHREWPFIDDDRDAVERGERVMLIIEDDAAFAKTLRDLGRQRGYKCIVTNSGRAGLAHALRCQPAAILLDLGLPDTHGLQVLEQLKFNLATRHVPVHVISAMDADPDVLKVGAVGQLTKPVGDEQVLAAIDEVGWRNPERQRRVLIVDDDAHTRFAVTRLIASDEVAVEHAASGGEALDALGRQRFDCVILDLHLPGEYGLSLLESLPEVVEGPLPPIIVYTGAELTHEQHRALEALSSSIVIKGPESPERLVDDVALFLHTIESKLPRHQREAIAALHDPVEALRGRKVLLVDDDVRNIFAITKRLRAVGLEVRAAENGAEALEILDKDDDVDIVLMDVMMPVMDGLEAMRRIRNESTHRDVPIIALTAKAMDKDRVDCIAAGATDYITKPLEFDQLIAMLRIWLFRKP